MEEQVEHNCENCGKDSEALSMYTGYGYHEETPWLCEVCFDDE